MAGKKAVVKKLAKKAVNQFALPKTVRRVTPGIGNRGQDSRVQKIFEHAEQERFPDYGQTVTEPVFDPSRAADVEAKSMAMSPQRSLEAELPPMPSRDFLESYPYGTGRGIQIMENEDAIGNLLAEDLRNLPDQGRMPFYSTWPILEALIDRAGLRPEQAQRFISDWAGQMAATSPRTKTPPNMRNASYLLYREGSGDPLTKAKWDQEGNLPGFPLIGRQHLPLSQEFFTDTVDPFKNPKPYSFQSNVGGNFQNVTADTHNIRAVLEAYDRLFPGTLQRGWFTDDQAFNNYREGQGFDPEGMLPIGGINDSLEGMTKNKRDIQYEYPLMQRPTAIAADKLGISPAEAQERIWFARGPRTGLMSPNMTIPDLLNAQIDKTARVLGIPPEEVLKLWAQRRIPLASNEPDPNAQGTSAIG